MLFGTATASKGQRCSRLSADRDPDRAPLDVMVKHTGERISLDEFRSGMARMYTQDL